jgi:hypothetical protein
LACTVLVIEWLPVQERIIAKLVRTVNIASIVRKIKARAEFVNSNSFLIYPCPYEKLLKWSFKPLD